MPSAREQAANQPEISVPLAPDEAARFEAYCQERGYKKSTLITRLIREHLDRERFHTQPTLFGGRGPAEKGQ